MVKISRQNRWNRKINRRRLQFPFPIGPNIAVNADNPGGHIAGAILVDPVGAVGRLNSFDSINSTQDLRLSPKLLFRQAMHHVF